MVEALSRSPQKAAMRSTAVQASTCHRVVLTLRQWWPCPALACRAAHTPRSSPAAPGGSRSPPPLTSHDATNTVVRGVHNFAAARLIPSSGVGGWFRKSSELRQATRLLTPPPLMTAILSDFWMVDSLCAIIYYHTGTCTRLNRRTTLSQV